VTGQSKFKQLKALIRVENYSACREKLRHAPMLSEWLVMAKRNEEKSREPALRTKIENNGQDIVPI
jgi:hypothetical protein